VVQIPQAVLHLSGGSSVWDPVTFVYGPLKGTARVVIPACDPEQTCVPTLSLDFAELNAAEAQAALLGTQKAGTLLSTVIARLSPAPNRKWPAFQGELKAGSLVLGPATLRDFVAEVKVTQTGAELTSVDAKLLGGHVHATGTVENGDKPSYALEGQFQQVNPVELCRLLELRCAGKVLDGDGKIQLTGYAKNELASSAKGSLHFEWKKGAVTGHTSDYSGEVVPPVLARFDTLSGDAEIANKTVTLGENHVQVGKRSGSVTAVINFGEPPRVSFETVKGQTAQQK